MRPPEQLTERPPDAAGLTVTEPIATPARPRHWWPPSSVVTDAAVVAGIVAGGFALFRPDWFHDQNEVDPYFYTGLSLNLSDAIDYGTDAHYFISRWTLYLPELVAQRILGPSAGFIATRLILMVLGGFGVALLRPAGSRRSDLVPVAVVSLFSPLMVRAVFVDYSDAIVVPCGLAMVALAAKARIGWRTSGTLGVLAACAVVANAFALVMVTITLAGYLARSLTRPRRLLAQVPVLVAAGGFVALAGLLFFRWRYGIDNVYAPTVDFVLSHVGYSDPLKSPRLLWLEHRLWIYLPALVLVAAAALRAARAIRLGPAEVAVLGICLAQYAFQIAYQFLADGSTLEINYYFSYMVPAYTAALAVLLYALLQRCSGRAMGTATAIVVVVLTAWRHLPDLRFANGASFAVAVVAVAGAGTILLRRVPLALPIGFGGLALAAQLGYPANEPLLPGELRVIAGYDTVYRAGTSTGVKRFRSTADFVRRMDEVDLQALKGAGWVVGRGTGPLKAAAYSVQVGQPSRWINPPLKPAGPDPDPPVELTPFTPNRFVERGLTHVVVVGTAEEVPGILDQLVGLGLVLGPPLLDYVDDIATPHTRVYVGPMTRQPSGAPAVP